MALSSLLNTMLRDAFQSHPRFKDILLAFDAIFVVFEDVVLIAQSRGWTIYSWETHRRLGGMEVEEMEQGMTVGSSELVTEFIRLRRKYDETLADWAPPETAPDSRFYRPIERVD